MYKDCLRQNSKLYVSTKSGYAKSKYKIQNIWDRLVHGKKERASAQVAFMVLFALLEWRIDYTGYETKLSWFRVFHEGDWKFETRLCSICITRLVISWMIDFNKEHFLCFMESFKGDFYSRIWKRWGRKTKSSCRRSCSFGSGRCSKSATIWNRWWNRWWNRERNKAIIFKFGNDGRKRKYGCRTI